MKKYQEQEPAIEQQAEGEKIFMRFLEEYQDRLGSELDELTRQVADATPETIIPAQKAFKSKRKLYELVGHLMCGSINITNLRDIIDSVASVEDKKELNQPLLMIQDFFTACQN